MAGEQTFNLFLSNREVAVLLWIGLRYVIGKVWKGRRDFVIREGNDAFFGRKFKPRIVIGIILTFHLVITGVLADMGWWQPEALRISIVYLLLMCCATVPSLYSRRSKFVSGIDGILANLLMLLFYQVGLNFYPLPLWAEMIVVPVLLILVVLAEAEYRTIYWGLVLAFLGICLGHYHFHGIAGLWTFRTWSEFLLAPFLTLTFLPVVYLLALFVMYKRTYDRMAYFIPNAADKKEHLRWLLRNCRMNGNKLEGAFLANAFAMAQTKSTEEMAELIASGDAWREKEQGAGVETHA